MPKNDNYPPRHRAGYGSLSITEKAVLDQWDEGATIEAIAETMAMRAVRVNQILVNFLPAGKERWARRREAKACDRLLAAQIMAGQHYLKPVELIQTARRLGLTRVAVCR